MTTKTVTVETLAEQCYVTPEKIRNDEIGGTFLYVHSIHEDRLNDDTGTLMTHLIGFTPEGASLVREHYTPVISWAGMRAAGIDTDRVDRKASEYDGVTPEYTAESADGATRMVFGVALDVDRVCAEGEPTGWDAAWYDLERDEDGFVYAAEHGTSNYYRPDQIDELYSDVAKVAPQVTAV